ncbi:MAG: hypothetical protein A3J24_11140 [Deltaproteobacteria bacterium RIFCSPLOWO2_02_FULL_53_8]|nr:MAG: hypothetical protein A3J24_11140 [Deltaproteobacteria bacterium RIFCSPLOWO2_02_FULL_53_8]
MRTLAKQMGLIKCFGVSATEEALNTVLYETVRNSHEHARRDYPSFRGVVFRKLIFSNVEDLEGRSSLPTELKGYIRRIWKSFPQHKHMFASFAIADVGPGIHNTLPSKAGEAAWSRLNRAFNPGESRKPSGALSSGEGLPGVISAARRLGAFLFVQSAELAGYRDFTLAEGEETLSPLVEGVPNTLGTSITILWPMFEDDIDQPSLFDPGDY